MPADPAYRTPKPLLDAINDALSALTDVVRSLRANSEARHHRAHEGVTTPRLKRRGTKPHSKPKARRKTRAIVVKATVEKDTQEVDAEVRGKHHGIKAKIVHAWDLLTRDPTAEARANGHGRRI